MSYCTCSTNKVNCLCSTNGDPSSWYTIPEIPPPPPPDAVTVTTPADAGDTERFVPKLIVPMVPTSVPSSLIMIPVPDAVTPVIPEPSPTKLDAVTIPTLKFGSS